MDYAFFLAHYSILLFSKVSPIILFTSPLLLYTTIYSTYYINVRKLHVYNTEQYNLVIATTVNRFTRDALINAHDAYMTVELYNNYYICMILHARSRMLQVLFFSKALKECSE